MGEQPRSDAVVRVENVVKQYRKAAHAHRYLTLKSALLGGDLFQALAPSEVFTALDRVTLRLGRGETLGVIGSNGAGKSTLLKIIAGTTKPTSGTVSVNGKISALIELGAGFHPEISGRENVFINGIMLGLSRQQVDERFDDIVAFAELEEFIDAPVKNYSSGMYMRLGFSIAIHIDPEVLLIDEVLAVGDEAFVHKCLDKIAAFKRRGKTILLVSHGLESVRRLCDRAVWMKNGKVAGDGDPPRVIDAYLDWVARKEDVELAAGAEQRTAAAVAGAGGAAPGAPSAGGGPIEGGGPLGLGTASGGAAGGDAGGNGAAGGGADASAGPPPSTPTSPETEAEAAELAIGDDGPRPYEPGRWGNQAVVIERVRLLDAAGEQHYVFACGDPVTIELLLAAKEPVEDFAVGVGIFNNDGVCCYGTNTDVERFEAERLHGNATVRIEVAALNLIAGTYYLDLAVHRIDGFAYDYQRGLTRFRMTSSIGDTGVARLPHSWSFEGGIRWKKSSPEPNASPRSPDH